MRVFAAVCLIAFSELANAWNAAGHAAVAAIAQARLLPAALAQVSFLLDEDLDRRGQPSGRHSLAEVASWADEIRSEAQKTGEAAYKGWHTRGNPVCEAGLGPCKDGFCVDQLIIRYARQLADRSQSRHARNEALKWVVHLVGDLHMPLHSGVNRNGGRARVLMDGYDLAADASFHSVWDSELLEAALAGWRRDQFAVPSAPLASDAPTRWMMEVRDVALHEVYEPLPDVQCKGRLQEPFRLDLAYQKASVGVIRRQIEQAGLRLAQLLNQSLR